MKSKRPNAAQVSATIAKAGIPRSSKYSVWGYETEGFIVTINYGTTAVSVLWSYSRQPAREAGAVAAERALQQAGYTVERSGSWQGPGASYWLRVVEPVASCTSDA